MKSVEEVMRECPLLVCTDHITKARKILRDDIYRELYVHNGRRKLMGYIDITDALRVADTKSNITVEGFLKEAARVSPTEGVEKAAVAIREAMTDSAVVTDPQGLILGVVLLSDIFPGLIAAHELEGKVKDYMTREVVTIGADDPVPHMYSRIVESGYTAFPVVKGSALVGIVSRRDILRERRILKSVKNLTKTPVESIMTTPAITIQQDEDVSHAAALLVRNDISRMPVLEGKKIVGIIDRHDVLKALKL